MTELSIHRLHIKCLYKVETMSVNDHIKYKKRTNKKNPTKNREHERYSKSLNHTICTVLHPLLPYKQQQNKEWKTWKANAQMAHVHLLIPDFSTVTYKFLTNQIWLWQQFYLSSAEVVLNCNSHSKMAPSEEFDAAKHTKFQEICSYAPNLTFLISLLWQG